jgi:radical SAM superfamily enzyme YgiQ (UPF0313 family)
MKKYPRVLLCIPPLYDRENPPLGTPALKGFLASNNISTRQIDLNFPFYDYVKKNKMDGIFSPEFVTEKMKNRMYYHRILEYSSSQNMWYTFEKYPGANYAFTEKMLSSKYLFRYIKDAEENIFVRYFQKSFLPLIEKERPRLAGFSIIGPSQVMASFTFGYLIKKHFPDIRIVIGGQWASFFREALAERSDFKSFYDYIIYFEGESPLVKLVRCIEDKGDFKNAPNLIYFENGAFRASSKITHEDMDKLPPPDFDGLPIMEYNNSKRKKAPVFTFETSRGCYWNKCIFCIDLPFPKPKYREKSPELVIRDLKFLRRKYNRYGLIISNTTFSPGQVSKISELILKNNINVKWWTLARFDPGFTYETLKLAKKAGCATMGFGLETINERLLKFIRKGTRADIIKRIIDDARRIKLTIYFQVVIGFPTETIEEAMDNITFLSRYKGAYKRASVFNIYYLVPKNYIFEHPEECGIRFKKDPKLPFRYFYPFKHISGEVDRKIAKKLISTKCMLTKHKIKKDAGRIS